VRDDDGPIFWCWAFSGAQAGSPKAVEYDAMLLQALK